MSKGKKILIILITAIAAGAFVFAGIYMLKNPPTFSSEATELAELMNIPMRGGVLTSEDLW